MRAEYGAGVHVRKGTGHVLRHLSLAGAEGRSGGGRGVTGFSSGAASRATRPRQPVPGLSFPWHAPVGIPCRAGRAWPCLLPSPPAVTARGVLTGRYGFGGVTRLAGAVRRRS